MTIYNLILQSGTSFEMRYETVESSVSIYTPSSRKVAYVCTVFIRIVAAATINFAPSSVRLLIEGGSYSRAATIYFARAQ